jgi:hypothetical protein
MLFGFMCTFVNHPLPFISKYQLNLPKKEDMQRFIDEQLKEQDSSIEK